MEQDKVRAEFEAWYFDRHLVVNRWDGLIYDDADQQEAWRAWRASRAAVVVELPEWFDRFDSGDRAYWVEDVEKAIKAAGIRTK